MVWLKSSHTQVLVLKVLIVFQQILKTSLSQLIYILDTSSCIFIYSSLLKLGPRGVNFQPIFHATERCSSADAAFCDPLEELVGQ